MLEVEVLAQFDFDPGKCQVLFKAGDRELLKKEFGWQNGKKFKFDFEQQWDAGEHPLSLELVPLTPADQKKNSLDLRILSVLAQALMEEKHWVRPANFDCSSRGIRQPRPPNAATTRTKCSAASPKGRTGGRWTAGQWSAWCRLRKAFTPNPANVSRTASRRPSCRCWLRPGSSSAWRKRNRVAADVRRRVRRTASPR